MKESRLRVDKKHVCLARIIHERFDCAISQRTVMNNPGYALFRGLPPTHERVLMAF